MIQAVVVMIFLIVQMKGVVMQSLRMEEFGMVQDEMIQAVVVRIFLIVQSGRAHV